MGINHSGAIMNEYRTDKREKPRHDMYTFPTHQGVFELRRTYSQSPKGKLNKSTFQCS